MDPLDELLERIREFQDAPVEASPIWQAKRELARHLRGFANTLCGSRASEQTIRDLSRLFEDKLPLLEEDHDHDHDGGSDFSDVAPGMDDFLDRGPMAGLSNPIAPPVEFTTNVDARRIEGSVTFGKALEGAPGCLHGGFVAAVLDEALGMACIFSGGPAMTVELTTHFRKNTPIERELRIEARMDGVESRKIRTSGELYDGDVVVAECRGLFIHVGSEKFAALHEAREKD